MSSQVSPTCKFKGTINSTTTKKPSQLINKIIVAAVQLFEQSEAAVNSNFQRGIRKFFQQKNLLMAV